LSAQIASLQDDKHLFEKQGRILQNFVLIFLVAYFVLFLEMPLHVNVYDEGIVLTASMRVAAGQLPHRDFYAIYGPAQFYILAGLFRLFGQSVLVERLLDLFFRALLAASVYTVASSYVHRSIAAITSFITLVWLSGLYFFTAGAAVIPVSLFNLISTALVIPVFTRGLSRRQTFAAGAIAGIASLFRYDTGIALLVIQGCVIVIGICHRLKDERLRAFLSAFGSYLVGFALMTVPPALYYLSVASLHPLIHDIFIFPSQYYHRARNLPFPAITWTSFDNFVVYLPIAIVGLSLYAVRVAYLRMRDNKASALSEREQQRQCGFLIAFSLLTVAMYLKGFVRISVVQMYLATIPSLLLVAVLFQQRFIFRRIIRVSIAVVTSLSLLSPAWCFLGELKYLREQFSSLPQSVWHTIRRTTPALEATWCRSPNSATRGVCFLSDDDRIQTIEFIDGHTRPDQMIYVGVTNHDRVFENDNFIYFASQRLPATRWSHFDPDLQNRYDIQAQMIQEMEINTPAYVVLDSEFKSREPNDSSRSSGVKLLDEYVHEKYQYIQTFGRMSLWQRIPSQS
jgi:hypothetical protein